MKFKEESLGEKLEKVPPICSNSDNIANVNLTITRQNMEVVPYEAFNIPDLFVNKSENDFIFYIGPNFNNSHIFQVQCSEKGFLSNFIMDVKFNVKKEFVGINRTSLGVGIGITTAFFLVAVGMILAVIRWRSNSISITTYEVETRYVYGVEECHKKSFQHLMSMQKRVRATQ